MAAGLTMRAQLPEVENGSQGMTKHIQPTPTGHRIRQGMEGMRSDDQQKQQRVLLVAMTRVIPQTLKTDAARWQQLCTARMKLKDAKGTLFKNKESHVKSGEMVKTHADAEMAA